MTMFENTINALRTLINVDAAIICTGSEDSNSIGALWAPFFSFYRIVHIPFPQLHAAEDTWTLCKGNVLDKGQFEGLITQRIRKR